MFLKISNLFMSTKAYWRTAPFAEMAQLYAARFVRTVAQSLVGSFVLVILYQKGYPVMHLFFIVAGYYGLRVACSAVSAHVVAWFGPKHTLLFSNIAAVPAFVSLAMVETYAFWGVVGFFFFEAISLSLLLVATDVQFSSVKNSRSAGRELAWMRTAEKVAAGVSPAVGGFLAYQFKPESVMWIAALLIVISALPLFGTAESMQGRQRVVFRGLPWASLWRQFRMTVANGVDVSVNGAVWPLFIAIAIFGTQDSRVYMELGLMFSLSVFASLIISQVYGRLIDRRKGRELFLFGVGTSALIHVSRPFINTPLGVGATNITTEVGMSAYSMPFVRAQYDVPDSIPGYRAVYFSLLAMCQYFGAMLFILFGAGLVWKFGEVRGMQLMFIVAALAYLFYLRNGFPSLRGRH